MAACLTAIPGDKLMKMLLPYDKKSIQVEIPDQDFVGSLVSNPLGLGYIRPKSGLRFNPHGTILPFKILKSPPAQCRRF